MSATVPGQPASPGSGAEARAAPGQPPSPALPVTVIRARGRWSPLDLRELWQHRELLYFLAWRDIKVRYKQTVLGAAWVVLQPLFLMVVFTFVFGTVAGLPSHGVPYAVFTFAALLPWQLFATSLNQASMSLVSNAPLVAKVYVPRLLLPASTLVGGLVDFGVAFGVLLGLLAWYQVVPPLAVVALPLLVLLALATAMSVGVWLAALNVQYRDVRYTLGFLTQVWMFATPVAYTASVVPAGLRPFYDLNPMVGVVEGFRWALLGTPFPGMALAWSASVSVPLFVAGLYYFRRVESRFADLI